MKDSTPDRSPHSASIVRPKKRPTKKHSEFNAAPEIDLHIHSTASDGTLSPAEILDSAVRLGLRAISITDHDTLEGAEEALSIGIPPSLRFLSGLEISASPPPSFRFFGSFHILGYGMRLDAPDLNAALARLREARAGRNPRILAALHSLGIEISMAELLSEAGGGLPGRPHIARLMVKKGVVGSIDEAFDRYIGKRGPAYVDKYRIESADAIEIIRNAGGLAVLAHPVLLKSGNEKGIGDLLPVLVSMGLGGLEVYYPEHGPDDVSYYEDLAGRYDLLITGGTDFHGGIKPEIRIGSGYGDMRIPYGLFENIARRIS